MYSIKLDNLSSLDQTPSQLPLLKRRGKRQFYLPIKVKIAMRVTPTYYHHDIFNQHPLRSSEVRYTPTYHSTVFEGQLQYVPEKADKKQINNSAVVFANHTMQQKLEFLNPQYSYGGHQTDPVKDEKDEMYHQINLLGGRTSRMRKCLEQMSNPIFNGCQWRVEISPQQNRAAQQRSYNPNRYCSPKKNEIDQQNQKILQEQLIQKSTELVKEPQPALKISQSKRPKIVAPKDKQKSKLNRFKSQMHVK